MKQLKYDIVVIGSGVGGLTSAALLSKAGYKTLVVEKLPLTGGRCSALDYHGYLLPTGAIMFTEECQGALCKEVGAEFELHVPESLYTFRIQGKDYPVPPAGALKTIISQVKRDDAEAERVWQAFKRSLTWAEPSYSMSFEEWIRQSTDNPSILGMFQYLTAMLACTTHSNVPAGEYFRMFKEFGFMKTTGYLPRWGGSFTDALVKAIEGMGGHVWTRCPALEVKIKNGAATGIIARKDNDEIEVAAQAVISNAAPRRTVELIGGEGRSPGYLKDVSNVNSVPGIIIYATSARPLLEGSSMIALTDARRLFGISDYTYVNPDCSPKGKYLIHGCAFLPSPKPPYDLKKDIELCLQDFRDNLPGFDKYADILKVNTFHGDWGVLGTLPGYSLPIKTPVEGLYLAGDASAPLGWWGAPAAQKSGRLVVEDIIQRYKST